MASELEQLRLEAEQLKNQIRVSVRLSVLLFADFVALTLSLMNSEMAWHCDAIYKKFAILVHFICFV